MTVGELIEHLKYGDTSTLVLVQNLREGDGEERTNAQRAVISFVNLATAHFYSIFDMGVSTEWLVPNFTRQIRVDNPKFIELLGLTYEDGTQLVEQAINGSDQWDYRTLSYNSWLLREPMSKPIVAMFRSAPPPVRTVDDTIPLPVSFMEALCNFVSAKAYNGSGSPNKVEQSIYFERLQYSIEQLKQQGYASKMTPIAPNVIQRGFI